MWTTLQPEAVSRLPKYGPNGEFHNGEPSVQLNSRPLEAWVRCFQELESFRQLQNDWDGQGAEAPAPNLLENAVNLGQLLRDKGIKAPCCVLPGVNGTVIFEWQEENGSYLEIEISEPNQADGYLMVPGRETEHWTLP